LTEDSKKPPIVKYLARPTPEGVIAMFEKLSGKVATPEETTKVHAEFEKMLRERLAAEPPPK
jgi:hypothetical protein